MLCNRFREILYYIQRLLLTDADNATDSQCNQSKRFHCDLFQSPASTECNRMVSSIYSRQIAIELASGCWELVYTDRQEFPKTSQSDLKWVCVREFLNRLRRPDPQ